MNRLGLEPLLCLFAFSGAVGFVAYCFAQSEDSWIARHVRAYALHLDEAFHGLFLRRRGTFVAMLQGVAILALATAAVTTGEFTLWMLVAALALAPVACLRIAQNRRRKAIDASLVNFGVALANSLNVVSSIGKALESVRGVMSGPLVQELGLTIKEIRLGLAVNDALLNMSARVNSPLLDALFDAVLVGRRVGGRVPANLLKTAEALRAMEREEGVLRAKTADGKAQMIVMAIAPVVIVAVCEFLDPGYFQPFLDSGIGMVLLGIAMLAWVMSLILARQILDVEL